METTTSLATAIQQFIVEAEAQASYLTDVSTQTWVDYDSRDKAIEAKKKILLLGALLEEARNYAGGPLSADLREELEYISR